MSKISATIVADSINQQGDRLISIKAICDNKTLKTLLNEHKNLNITYTDIDLIETDTVIGSIETNPFIPIAWKREYKSMQGSEYLTDPDNIADANSVWLMAREDAIFQAKLLSENEGVTKQLCNRLLEPFMWTTMLITGSREGWDNFFHLRCPKYDYDGILSKSWKEIIERNKNISYTESTIKPEDISLLDRLKTNKGQAEIHMMMLSEKIYDAIQESTPVQLKEGEWHIPMIKIIED